MVKNYSYEVIILKFVVIEIYIEIVMFFEIIYFFKNLMVKKLDK